MAADTKVDQAVVAYAVAEAWDRFNNEAGETLWGLEAGIRPAAARAAALSLPDKFSDPAFESLVEAYQAAIYRGLLERLTDRWGPGPT